ncbi:hypothetical protein ASU31_00750 [Pedobacter ginsenosidimutans]|uniref:DUF4859 domain-containing protein n=1 Tax=Pedobacter ginsenosidimutans TaxID=687842 RepID=A0A0T5VVR8_9SPHI|nr:DUF6055 domain-containing protein [Pedobacter ginsenosidimutans]KRT17855.1 hypothetical protein ASU31_00750 [Pedobacter ginsenosidimutans]
MKRGLFTALSIILIFIISCKKSENKVAGDQAKPVAEKKVYLPNEWKKIDLNNNDSEWSNLRSAKSANVVVFWQKGFGDDPSKATDASMRFNKEVILQKAERIYETYRNTLKFTGLNTRTDSLRMMIQVVYSKDWVAAGSGWDNIIGALWVTPRALNIDAVLAHELGHCFQYQVACDGMYGFRDQNYVGSFWEQCAQYMARQIYPASQLDDLKFFTDNSYRNFSNEEIRYQSFHLQEYWKLKRGADFIGKLWRGAIKPEHPLQTYKRIAGIDQPGLNDEIADYAMRCVSWDLPNGEYVRSAATRTNARLTTKLIKSTTDNSYIVDPTVAPEPYGFNAFELNMPTSSNQVSVSFTGLDNTKYKSFQGWRYGFVSLDAANIPTYGTLGKTDMGTVSFTVPASSVKLWFVVTGAPVTHYNHVWGTSQIEIPKFNYKVNFSNTSPKI